MGSVILITGANGFLGSALVAYWANKNNHVIATDLQPNFKQGDFENLIYLPLDICDFSQLKNLSEKYKINTIVHCAALLAQDSSEEVEQKMIRVNLEGSRLITKLAVAQKARLIFPSTAMVYGLNKTPFEETMAKLPTNLYALTKSLAEDFIEYYGRCHDLSYAIIRIPIVYGPQQSGAMLIPSAIETLSKNLPYEMTQGEQNREFIYINDLLALFDLIQGSKINGVFHGGGSESNSILDVVKMIQQKLNSSSHLLVGKRPYRANELWEYCMSPSKNSLLLGWQPTTSLSEGLDKTIEYFVKPQIDPLGN